MGLEEIHRIRTILQKYMNKASEELSNNGTDVGWWGPNTTAHMAEAALLILVNQRESQDDREANQ